MRSNHCLTILHASVLALLVGTVEADSECETGMKVRRNTVYEALHGQDLIINCIVVFCNSSPPAVSWYKVNGSINVPVDVSSSSHIKAEWKELSHSEGISHLIFQNILSSDSGLYRCGSGDAVSHQINVSVSGCVTTDEPTTVLQMTLEKGAPTAQTPFWPCGFRVVSIMLFLIIVIAIWATSKCRCKGVCCAGGSRNAAEPSCQPSHQASPTVHIYENDPSVP
ncbi:B- and T-lymphocyte attenuator-like [Trachinotus anak]|uniref:B- and T-lymphocyte attenuator-like n=1 Tax=Trachinotus anak TaxID=443729 RepID=UPI0039F1E0A5